LLTHGQAHAGNLHPKSYILPLTSLSDTDAFKKPTKPFGNIDTDRYLRPVRNPNVTKERILRKSGVLFNTQGYKATSISDITDATGFTKGAIYRHFESKQDLEKETLFHLSGLMFEKLRGFIKDEKTAVEKLHAIFKFFESYVTNPEVKGGCPLMNAAIEADDAHPVLRKGAVKILDILHESVVRILKNGVKHGQIRKDIDVDYYATIIIASVEGAIMMSKLRGNNDDIRRVVKHLKIQVKHIEL
jgi:TetR/AcrR family transcriptional regulator, transcriptional repressor for nem operon